MGAVTANKDGSQMVRVGAEAWGQIVDAAREANVEEVEFIRRACGLYAYVTGELAGFEQLCILNEITDELQRIELFPDQPSKRPWWRRRPRLRWR